MLMVRTPVRIRYRTAASRCCMECMCQVFKYAPVFRTFQSTATTYYYLSLSKRHFTFYLVYGCYLYFSISCSSLQLFYLCSSMVSLLDTKTVWIDRYNFHRRCNGYIGKCFSGKNRFTYYKTITGIGQSYSTCNQASFELSSYTRCYGATRLIMREDYN